MIDIVLRCFSRARWITVATSRGILDANGNPNPGYAVDEIGTDAEIAPGVLDTWYWINLRIYNQAADADADTVYPGEENDTSGFKFVRSKLVRWIRDQSTPLTLTYRGRSVRVYQFGATTNRVQVIDPRDYADIRVREWMGGQSF